MLAMFFDADDDIDNEKYNDDLADNKTHYANHNNADASIFDGSVFRRTVLRFRPRRC